MTIAVGTLRGTRSRRCTVNRPSTFAEERLPAQLRGSSPAPRVARVRITLLASVAALLPVDAAAQYWSLGVSVGGGTTIAAHMGMHLGNTDRRRESGLTGGRTEVELVIGLSRFVLEDGGKKAKPSFGLNLRQTARDSGISGGLGFRVAPVPPGATGGYRVVIHVPVGVEPYPLPARLFVFVGFGKRVVPSSDEGLFRWWESFITWPQLQVYLRHTGGFHWT